MLITAAQAQTAEATQAAVQATEILLQYKVLGAACIFLLIAVGVLFTLLLRSYGKFGELVGQAIVTAESAKATAAASTTAANELRATVGTLVTGVEALSRETEGAERETRHGLANISSKQDALASLLAQYLNRGRE